MITTTATSGVMITGAMTTTTIGEEKTTDMATSTGGGECKPHEGTLAGARDTLLCCIQAGNMCMEWGIFV